MQRFGSLLAGRYGVDGELRSCEDVASGKDVRFRCLVSQFVRYRVNAPEKLDLRILDQVAGHDGLADGEDHQVGVQGEQLIFIVFINSRLHIFGNICREILAVVNELRCTRDEEHCQCVTVVSRCSTVNIRGLIGNHANEELLMPIINKVNDYVSFEVINSFIYCTK